MARVLGIGWDVGGWMGFKQGFAAAVLDTDSGMFNWLGSPFTTTMDIEQSWTPERIIKQYNQNDSIGQYDYAVIGIDASLGYPIAYRELIHYKASSMETPDKEIYNRYAYRDTERHIYEKFGKKPLSAPFDKLGNNSTLAISYALEWSKYQNFSIHPQTEAENDQRVIIEVYPALLKSHNRTCHQNQLLSLISDEVPLGTDEHDAAICALLAILYKGNGRLIENVRLSKPSLSLETVREEGWIYYMETYDKK